MGRSFFLMIVFKTSTMFWRATGIGRQQVKKYFRLLLFLVVQTHRLARIRESVEAKLHMQKSHTAQIGRRAPRERPI